MFPLENLWNSLGLPFLIFKESIRFLWGLNKCTFNTIPGPQKACNNLGALVSFLSNGDGGANGTDGGGGDVMMAVVTVIYLKLRHILSHCPWFRFCSSINLYIDSASNHHSSHSVPIYLPTWYKSVLLSSFLPILSKLNSPTPGPFYLPHWIQTWLMILYLCHVPLLFSSPFLLLESLWRFSFLINPCQDHWLLGGSRYETHSSSLSLPHGFYHDPTLTSMSRLHNGSQGPAQAFYIPIGSLARLEWWQTLSAGTASDLFWVPITLLSSRWPRNPWLRTLSFIC